MIEFIILKHAKNLLTSQMLDHRQELCVAAVPQALYYGQL